MPYINKFGQPIGDPVPDWKPRQIPQAVTLTGQSCRIEPLNVTKHVDDLFAAFSHDDGRLWTYMAFGPFANVDEFRSFIELELEGRDQYYAVIDLSSEKPVGMRALKRSDPVNGVTEIGRTVYSPLKKSAFLSTETGYLMMSYVFDQLGYRRYECCCETLNVTGRKAIERVGFKFEGIFHQVAVEKGHNSDVAWYSITDKRWPVVKLALETWLSPDNFNENGREIRKLEDIRKQIERKTNGVPSSL